MQRGTVLTGDTSKQVRDQKEFEATQAGCDKRNFFLKHWSGGWKLRRFYDFLTDISQAL